MIINKPSIFIYTHQAEEALIKEICAGIEEEGVSFTIFERDTRDPDTLAWEAAGASMMGSGIGISGSTAALQMKGMPKSRNIEFCDRPDKEACRRLGANSARGIKKQPFL